MIIRQGKGGIKVNGNFYKIVVFSFLFVLCAGCVGQISQIQRGMNILDDTWKVANDNLNKTLGTREYKISKKEAFNAMVITLTELGFIIENQDYETGFVLAKGHAPAPLTNSEGEAVKEIEDPKMQALLAPEIGELSANRFKLGLNHFYNIINVHMLERSKDLQISLRSQYQFKGDMPVIAVSQQGPPTALEHSLKKIWNTFEKTAFIQGGTFK